MSFDEWMECVLYDEQHGFYASGGSAGKRGKDFLTSPEVGPLFGAVLARYIEGCWREFGCPDDFWVVEAGAGRGALAASILRALGELRLGQASRQGDAQTGRQTDRQLIKYLTVERSAALRATQLETLKPYLEIANGVGASNSLEILSELPDAISSEMTLPENASGIVIANELLDNLPFKLLEFADAGWQEVMVSKSSGDTQTADSSFAETSYKETLRPASAEIAAMAEALLPEATAGMRIPLHLQAAGWLRRACGLFGKGRVIVFDYGTATTAELSERRNFLRTYSQHAHGASPLENFGRQDITSDVAFDQLLPATKLQTQAEFLECWGIAELVVEGEKIWQENAHNPNSSHLAARSRKYEAQALCDPDSFGSYLVAEWEMN